MGTVAVQKYGNQCIEDIFFSNTRDTSDGLTAVLEFADYCQLILDLEKWPAQKLCNEFGNEVLFPVWIGDTCSHPCYFGHKDIKNGDLCLCSQGFWGTSCEKECPGGHTNPCTGFGSCDQKSGLCTCPINRKGSTDCSLCTEGWLGEDCSLTADVRQRTVGRAHMTATGNVFTLDGLNFLMSSIGQFHLMNINPYMFIQGKLVRCLNSLACTRFIAIRVANDLNVTEITIQGAKSSIEMHRIYIDNKISHILGTLFYPGFEIKRTSIHESVITIYPNIIITVRSSLLFLDLDVDVPVSVINYTSGILSGTGTANIDNILSHIVTNRGYVSTFDLCNITVGIFEPVNIRSGQINTMHAKKPRFHLSSDLGNLTYQAIDDYIKSFDVSECDLFIHYPSTGDKHQFHAGFALKFNGSSVYNTEPSNLTNTDNITIELFVKVDNGQEGCLFSFANAQTFSLVYHNGTIQINIEDITFDTHLQFDYNVWTKIMFVYEGKNGRTNIYLFKKNGYIKRKQLIMSVSIFRKNGTFVVGQWQPPLDGNSHLPKPPFTGQIDMLRIWNIAIEPSIVMDVLSFNVLLSSPAINSIFSFDEGEGTETKQVFHGFNLLFTKSPWLEPEWLPSDAPEPHYLSPLYFSLENETQLDIAKNICQSIFKIEKCSKMNNGTKSFYFMDCVRNVMLSRSSQAGYKMMYIYIDTCKLSLNENSLLTEDICKSVDNRRLQKDCKHANTCYFGHIVGSQCQCLEGFHGTDCSLFCPIVNGKICNGRGYCTEYGNCECQINWRGKIDCSECSDHWKGNDCSLLKLSKMSNDSQHHAWVSSTGVMYISFDGLSFDIDDISSIFTVMDQPLKKLMITVHQVICQFGSCIDSVDINYQNSNITVKSSHNHSLPTIYVNGKLVIISGLEMHISHSIILKLLTNFDIEVIIDHTLMKIELQFHGRYIFMHVQSDAALCENATGLLGSCDGKSENDFEFDYINHDHAGMLAKWTRLYGSKDDSRYFKDMGLILNTLAGYALSFDRTSTSTLPLKHIVGKNNEHIDITISFLVKPFTYGGIILCYSKTTTFAVSNDAIMKIHVNGISYSTPLTNILKTWNQVVISYQHSTSELHLYHFGPSNNLTYFRIRTTITDFFTSDGVLTLGEWQSSPDNHTYVFNSSFFGQIDELVVWNKILPHSIILQSHMLNTRLKVFKSDLKYLYKFSEGNTLTSNEYNYFNSFHLPHNPWKKPTWSLSSANVKDIKVYKLIRYEIDKRCENQILKNFCSNIFANIKPCKDVDLNLRNKLIKMCDELLCSTNMSSYAVMSLAVFTKICLQSSALHLQLQDLICYSLNNSISPYWLAPTCKSCIFGFIADNSCICHNGFYGTNCNKICPGGLELPCNGHGKCSESGNCVCDYKWSGYSCEKCSPGWLGDDCVVMVSNTSQAQSNIFAQVQSRGRVMTFDSITFDLLERKTYLMLNINSSNFFVYGRLADCIYKGVKYLCFDSFLVKTENSELYFNINSIQNSHVQVWFNSKAHTIYTSAHLDMFTIERITPISFKISNKEIGISFKLTVHIDGIIMLINTKFKQERTGILGSCDTLLEIQTANCSNMLNMCLKDKDEYQCKGTLSKSNFKQYIKKYEVFGIFERFNISNTNNISGICLFYNDNGVFSNILLPIPQFTLELHVKVAKYGGVIVALKGMHTVLLVNTQNGIEIHYDTNVYKTNIVLRLEFWSQISIVWNEITAIFGVYIIDTFDVVKVQSFSFQSNTFHGTVSISLGQLPPNTIPKNDILGYFVGFIDELRIWKRIHHPSLVLNNIRIMVTENSPDLSFAWGFNEGVGTSSIDFITQSKFSTISTFYHPKWVSSDLILTHKLGITQPSTLPHISDLANTTYQFKKLCEKLFSDKNLLDKCNNLGAPTKDSYLDLCVKQISMSNDPNLAAQTLRQYAELCQLKNNIDEPPDQMLCRSFPHSVFPVWVGTNCQTKCIFGQYIDDICKCTYGFWGKQCSRMCPEGENGICNTHGHCSLNSGQCMCHPRWMAHHFSTDVYISPTSLTLNNYVCSKCTDGWYGTDCNIAYINTTQSHTGVAVLYGSFMFTFDGAAFEISTSGIYEIVQFEKVSIKILYTPCHSDVNCRRIAELSYLIANKIISVQFGLKINVYIYEIDSQVYDSLKFPTTRNINEAVMSWEFTENIIRIVTGDIVLVTGIISDDVLVAIRVSSQFSGKLKGMLGNYDGSWQDDLYASQSQTEDFKHFLQNVLSAPYLSKIFKQEFGVGHAKHIYSFPNPLGKLSIGFMLELKENLVKFRDLPTMPLDEFTITLWARIGKSANIKILHSETSVGDLKLEVLDERVIITWGQYVETDIVFPPEEWLYMAASWRNYDGRFTLYCLEQTVTKSHFSYGFHTNKFVALKSVTLGHETTSLLNLDYIQFWSYAKPLSEIVTNALMYKIDYSKGLRFTILLDEGKDMPNLIHFENNGITKTIVGQSFPDKKELIWLPADIPVEVNMYPNVITDDTISTNTLQCCLEIFMKELLKKHCEPLQTLYQIILESCIRHVRQTGDCRKSMLMESAYVFICQGITETEECVFKGYLDFCEETDFPVLNVVLICIAVLISISCCCLVCFVLKKKKRSKKKSNISGHNDDNDEFELHQYIPRRSYTESYTMIDFRESRRTSVVGLGSDDAFDRSVPPIDTNFPSRLSDKSSKDMERPLHTFQQRKQNKSLLTVKTAGQAVSMDTETRPHIELNREFKEANPYIELDDNNGRRHTLSDISIGFPNETKQLFKVNIPKQSQLSWQRSALVPRSLTSSAGASYENEHLDVDEGEREKRVLEFDRDQDTESTEMEHSRYKKYMMPSSVVTRSREGEAETRSKSPSKDTLGKVIIEHTSKDAIRNIPSRHGIQPTKSKTVTKKTSRK